MMASINLSDASVILAPVDGDATRLLNVIIVPCGPSSSAKTRHKVGRAPSNDTVIELQLISSLHFTVTAWKDGAGNGVAEIFNSSSNGVWINNVSIPQHKATPVHTGDVVTILRAAGMPHLKYKVFIVNPGDEIPGASLPSQYSLPSLAQVDYTTAATKSVPTAADTVTAASSTTTSGSVSSGATTGAGSVVGGAVSGAPRAVVDIHSFIRSAKITDDYEFIEQLGDGAFSVVYKALKRSEPGTYVAVKRVDVGITERSAKNHKSEVNPLEEEIKVLANLDNLHIVKLHEVVRDPEQPRYLYIVQELVTGGELFNKVVGKGNFQEAQARGLFKQLVAGVAYLHKCGVVHRDLKPENILLQPYEVKSAKQSKAVAEKRYCVKITDFGMARMTPTVDVQAAPEAPAPGARLTRMSTLVGTKNYLGVELYGKSEQISWKTWMRKTIEYMQEASARRFRGATKSSATTTAAVAAQQRRTRADFEGSIPGVNAGVFNDPSLPPGCHYYPTKEDFEAIEHAYRTGYTETIDSWSMGVILYICLCGQMPFWWDEDSGRPSTEVQMLVQFVDFESPIWSSISAEARDLVQHLLHPNPQKRLTAQAALAHPWFRGATSTSAGLVDAAAGAGKRDPAAEAAERKAAEGASLEEAAEGTAYDARIPTDSVPASTVIHDVSMGRPEYSTRPNKRARRSATSADTIDSK